MNILYLTEIIPYPLDSGGKIKTFHTLKILSKKHRVFLVCFINNFTKKGHIQAIKRLGIKIFPVFSPKTDPAYKNSFWEILKNMFQGSPAMTANLSHKTFSQKIKKIVLEQSIDIIHIDHISMAQYLPPQKKQKWVLESHNIEYLVEWELTKYAPTLKSKIFHFIETVLLYLYERQYLKKFDLVFSISNKDKKQMIKMGIEKNKIKTLPIPFRTNKLFEFSDSKQILFIGNLWWFPNEDAVIWFANEVFPLIQKTVPNVVFNVIGGSFENCLKQVSAPSAVNFLGYVKKLNPYLKQASVFVLPLKIGGGLKIKALTALAAGIPLVSTLEGIAGLGPRKNIDEVCLVAKNAKEFARQTIKILTRVKIARKLSQNSIKFIQKNYSQQRGEKILLESYSKILEILAF